MRNISVCGVILEEFSLALQSVFQLLFRVDILLASIHDTDESQLERVDSSGKDIERIRTGIHEVEFSEDTDRSAALLIDGTCELERFGVGKVDIGR